MSLREWHSCSAQASWKKRDQIRLSSILFPDRLYLWRPHFSAHILPIFCRVHALVQMTRPSRRRNLSPALSTFLLPLGQGHVSAHAPRVDSCVPAFHALAIASPGQPSQTDAACKRSILANDGGEIAVFAKFHDDVDGRGLSVDNAVLSTPTSKRHGQVAPPARRRCAGMD